MIAVDTNILVRLLTEDDPKQALAAKSLFASETVWIAKTVLLETAWVLRSAFGYDDTVVRAAFLGLIGLNNVEVQDEATVRAALALTIHGVEFADALHVSSKPDGVVFVSFDKSLVLRAARAGVQGVVGVSVK